MERVKNLLKDIGYSESAANRIINHNSLRRYQHTLLLRIPETIFVLKNYNFSLKKVIKMTTEAPGIFAVKINVLENKIEELKIIGYTKEQILKILLANPNILVYSTHLIKDKINSLKNLGFNYEQILKMSLKLPTIYDLNIDKNIKQKIDYLITLGFTEEQTIKMAITHPDIFSYSQINICNKINFFLELGFSKEETINIIYILPTTLGLTENNIRNKIEFLKSIDGLSLIRENPRRLMQSVKLTYARYQFFIDHAIEFLTYDKLLKELFVGKSYFNKKYNVSNFQLLSKYPYHDGYEDKTK